MASGAQEIPRLPQNKTVVRVLADFLQYLYKCARDYVQETHAAGSIIWQSVQERTEFVLTHPNGWEGLQQSQMRQAAVLAGLILDTPDGRSKIQFVTEGEASLHFCVGNGLAKDAIKMGQGFIIVDAGGGTIDLSAYSLKSYFQGSVFVSRRARELLQVKLEKSPRFSDPKTIDDIVSCFDKIAKITFKHEDRSSWTKFGGVSDNDPLVGIKAGKLKLAGTDVAKLFEPSIQAIVDGIVEQLRTAQQPIKTIFLVGGFAASDWLFSKLQHYLQPLGMEFCRPDGHVNKAVADGAISYYIDHYVTVRVARFTYGAVCFVEYDKTDPQHLIRPVFTRLSGKRVVRGCFSVILSKGTQVSESEEFRRSYHRELNTPSCRSISSEIKCYRGLSKDPQWTDIEPDMFSTMCTVKADVGELVKTLHPQRGLTGDLYYQLGFDIILIFGLTELKAQLAWMENGKEKRGPATIVYE